MKRKTEWHGATSNGVGESKPARNGCKSAEFRRYYRLYTKQTVCDKTAPIRYAYDITKTNDQLTENEYKVVIDMGITGWIG